MWVGFSKVVYTTLGLDFEQKQWLCIPIYNNWIGFSFYSKFASISLYCEINPQRVTNERIFIDNYIAEIWKDNFFLKLSPEPENSLRVVSLLWCIKLVVEFFPMTLKQT
jgi:hypothetical protein